MTSLLGYHTLVSSSRPTDLWVAAGNGRIEAAEPVVCHAPVRDGFGSTVAVSRIGCAFSAVEFIPHALTNIP